jgi:hypothetical protein
MLITTSATESDRRADTLLRDWPGLRVEVALGSEEIAARLVPADDRVVVECPSFDDSHVELFCDTLMRIQRLRVEDPGPLAFVPGRVPGAIADCGRSPDPWEICHSVDDEGDLAYLHLGSAVVANRLLPDFCSLMRDRSGSARLFAELLKATQAWP